ncbi:hypothetical protein [Streptomyces sp. P17]|uniref:hypothetical protein n=1 Tax=Streptomyces sp. P17 TaxID=3074716 RepID=UPI0028F424A8|nr:hypothetical protein [Streptomyces sp. P17]MDT9698091.1 hypothetical protein [Streptomyces sp. P17]
MTAGWCTRTIRAAVFAAVCVLLAALGHVLMSGFAAPWWAVGAGFAVTAGVAWCLAGRERGLPLVVSLVVAVQAALHSAFEFAQTRVPASPTGADAASAGLGSAGHSAGPAMGSMGHDMGGMSMGFPSGDSPPMTHMDMGAMGHDMSGGSSFGMWAAHTLAALLCGLWLAHGERAAFRVLRAVAGWLAAPLRLPLFLPAPLPRPRLRPRRRRSDRGPRLLLLVHSVTSRGPPAGTAVI